MKQVISFKIDDIPPSNNQYLGRTGTNWNYNREKKKFHQLIEVASYNKIPNEPINKSNIHIHYIFPDNRRRDPDNYSGKMLLDPLVSLGIIQDDSFKCVDLTISAETIKGIKETHISISEI